MASQTGSLSTDGVKTRIVGEPGPGTSRRVSHIVIHNPTDFAVNLQFFSKEMVGHPMQQQAVYRRLYAVAIASGGSWEWPTTDHVGEFVLDDPTVTLVAAVQSGVGQRANYYTSAADG